MWKNIYKYAPSIIQQFYKFSTYQVKLVHELVEDDYDTQLEFFLWQGRILESTGFQYMFLRCMLVITSWSWSRHQLLYSIRIGRIPTFESLETRPKVSMSGLSSSETLLPFPSPGKGGGFWIRLISIGQTKYGYL